MKTREVNARSEQATAAESVRRTAEAARDAVLLVVWEQWRALGSLATPIGECRATSIVDPEALVLCSLILRDDERRLDDFLGWWAEKGASLSSVQRMLNLSGRFPGQARPRIGAFARTAAEAGHKRWRRHAASADEMAILLEPRGGKGRDKLDFAGAPALMLRLRAGFGVGAKADLLTFLIGNGGAFASVREAALALSYTDAAVRVAAQEMTVARFIEEAGGRPTEYAVNVRRWVDLLRVEKSGAGHSNTSQPTIAPPWRYWDHVLAFLTGVLEWARIGSQDGWSPYILSSRARDLHERSEKAFRANRINLPAPVDYRGTAYLSAFEATVVQLKNWIAGHI